MLSRGGSAAMNLICVSCGGFTYFEVEVEAFKAIEVNDDG
jgi:hypothetical protein